MTCRTRIFVQLALVTGLLSPGAFAQKPPSPAPTPQPPTAPGRPVAPGPPTSQPGEPEQDLVMFLQGHVATRDGAPVPNNVLIERICNASVRQQVYASPRGDFTMQMGSMTDSFLDASGDHSSPEGVANGMANKDPQMGISRRELANCELRASVSGFHSSVINLVDLTSPGSKSIDVGAIVVQRSTKPQGNTLSAIPYKAPKDARKAYENGLHAERDGKLADARKYFERAVEIHPVFADAWFHLGTVLQKQDQKDSARAAFTHATTIDTKLLPAYLSLASIACEAENWSEVLTLTSHILDADPLNHVTGYVLDLDYPLNYAQAYFFNSLANYKLNRFEAAEKSGLKAERVDLRSHFPQLHLILADIFARKSNYATAIAEIQTYLELAPRSQDADQARERLAELQKLNPSTVSQ